MTYLVVNSLRKYVSYTYCISGKVEYHVVHVPFERGVVCSSNMHDSVCLESIDHSDTSFRLISNSITYEAL